MGWQRFQSEARLLAKLDHLNLVRVFDLGIHEGCLPFYAMDFIDGLTLADMVAQNGRLSVKMATEIFKQVCDGTDFAHRNGIIHRDLKPANIMIVGSQSPAQRAGQPEKITVKILDFGLAKLTQHDRSKQSLTAIGEIFGSPFYMSPEQCSGEKIDNRSDIYSVGCALFESLTERPPFYGNVAAAIMNGHQYGDPPMLASVVGAKVFPDSLEVVVAKLLRKNPAERYQTMAEVKGDLERVAGGESVQPYYVSRAKAPAQSSAVCQEPDHTVSSRAIGNRPTRLLLFGGLTTIIVVAGLVITLTVKDGGSPRVIVHSPRLRDQGPKKPLDSSVPEVLHADGLEGMFEPSESFVAAHSKPVTWDGKPFFRGVVNRPGTTFKLWQFPTTFGFDYGRLGIVNPETTWVAMSGSITAPASAQFCIALQPTILNSPNLLNGFIDGSFDGIRFENATTPQFKKMASALARFQSIHRLDFLRIDSDSSFDQECVKVINHYPNLTQLDSRMLADGGSFSQLHRLKMLEALALFGLEKNYDKVFLALAGSTHLTKLTLDNIPISASAVRALIECPNLKVVHLYLTSKDLQSQVDQIAPLADLKQLSSLQLQSLNYSQALIDTFRKFQTLKDLNCELGRNWSPQGEMSLRQALPYTDIWLSRPARDTEVSFDQTVPQLAGHKPDFGYDKATVHFRPLRKSEPSPSR